jgi:hypothetical protein
MLQLHAAGNFRVSRLVRRLTLTKVINDYCRQSTLEEGLGVTAQLDSAAEPTIAVPERLSKPHPIRSLLITRLCWGVLTVLAVAVIVYAATLVLPGDAAQAILG